MTGNICARLVISKTKIRLACSPYNASFTLENMIVARQPKRRPESNEVGGRAQNAPKKCRIFHSQWPNGKLHESNWTSNINLIFVNGLWRSWIFRWFANGRDGENKYRNRYEMERKKLTKIWGTDRYMRRYKYSRFVWYFETYRGEHLYVYI